jgi:ABC-type branched-subunit amino acid transport system substrate-binding protein
VSATRVELGLTLARSGPQQATGSDVQAGIEAAQKRINDAGGVCGRHLEIEFRDDGDSPAIGPKYLNDMAGQIFAIPVEPSTETLNTFILSGDAEKARIPIVGTLGQTSAEFHSNWAWPVSPSQDRIGRVFARTEYGAGARTFGTVFAKNYLSFTLAARSYDAEVLRLTTHHIDGYNSQDNCQRRFCGVAADQPAYGTQQRDYYADAPDATAYLLDSSTALTWIATAGGLDHRRDGAPTLFTRDFAIKCQSPCDGMHVWNPYLSVVDSADPAVKQYVDAMRDANPESDAYNSVAEGAYSGMLLLADAMARVGVDLTRAKLQSVLGSQTFEPGLTVPIRYALSHDGNRCLRSYTIRYEGTFGGWRPDGGWVCDTSP